MRKVKISIILTAIFLVNTGCGNKTENIHSNNNIISTQAISTVGVKVTPTNTTDETSLLPIFPTTEIVNNASQFNQLLPNGIYTASVLNRTYVYQSEKDEKREQILEKKFRKGIELLIANEKNERDLNGMKAFYNKDTPFRSNTYPIINDDLGNGVFRNESVISFEEWEELIELYNSAKMKLVEDKKTCLNISSKDGKINITTDKKSTKFIDSITLDIVSNKATVGGKVLDYAGFKKDSDLYKEIQYIIRKTYFKINDEDFDQQFIWFKHEGLEFSTFLIVGQLSESKTPLLKYVIYDYTNNKFTEDFLYIYNK